MFLRNWTFSFNQIVDMIVMSQNLTKCTHFTLRYSVKSCIGKLLRQYQRNEEVMMNKRIKLTSAQLALLKEKNGAFIDSYKPGLRLIELGFIDVIGNGYYHWTINAAGEEFLTTVVAM